MDASKVSISVKDGENATKNGAASGIPVNENDSLRSIAVKFGNITPSQLAEYNNIAVCGGLEVLHVGQVLDIPTPDQVKDHVCRKKQHSTSSSGKSAKKCDRTASYCFDSHYSIPIGNFENESSTELGDFSDENVTKVDANYVDFLNNAQLEGSLIISSNKLFFQTNPVPYRTKKTSTCSTEELSENSLIEEEPNQRMQQQENCDRKCVHYLSLNFESVTSFNTHTDLAKLLTKNEKVVGSLPSNIKLPVSPDGDDDSPLDDKIYIALCSSRKKSSTRSHAKPKITTNGNALDVDTFCEEIKVFHTDKLEFQIFRIPLSKFECICQIMLRPNFEDDDLLDTDQEENKRQSTLVETALLEMDNVSVTIQLRDGSSKIFSDEMLQDLALNLPVHWYGSDLRYIYSSSNDGFSLSTIYRKARDLESAIVLVIRDTTRAVFGSIMSETMHCSNHFYGTGESCVFTWNKGFKVYNWTKKNHFFMRGSSDCFLIGAQSGHSAIWFDEALKYGRSEATETFDNPVLCGDSSEYSAKIKALLKTNQKNDSSSNMTCGPHSPNESMLFLIEQVELWELVN